ncbi:MAG: lipopolysaccharide biosynthesis protein [Oscillospiraceae bacterium]|nr:lipopolysaccharide biosynthesis protein [Oscillospiraceae bacterium]
MDKRKSDILSGVFWKFSERILAQLISTVVAIVLARILSPDEYGTVSLVMVFISISNVIMTAGFNTSLIQKKDADNLDFSTVFFFSIGFSLVLYAILYAISPFVAKFYNIAELKPVLRILALAIPVMAVNSVQQAYVSRHMMFKRFFWSTLFGTMLSGVVGLVLAYRGFGVYALVAQNLTNTVVDTTVLWFTVKWRPSWVFSFDRLKGLFSYGWKLLVQNIVVNIYSSLRSLIIGKAYTTADLAYYTKGSQYPNLIATNVDTALNSALFPAVAKEQNDVSRVRSMTRRTTKLSSFIMAPILIGFMAVADSFLGFLLTDKWLPAAPYLRIICMVLIFLPAQTAMLQAIKAVGRSDVVLKIDIPVRVFATVVLFLSVQFGVIYVAMSEVAVTIFGTAMYMLAAKKVVDYTPTQVLSDFLPNVCTAAVMGVATWLLGKAVPFSWGPCLIIQVAFGACCYVALSAITKNESFFYIINVLKSWLASRKGKV